MKKWISLLLGLIVLTSATVVIYAAAVQGTTVGSYHVYYDGGADGVTGLPSDDHDYTAGSIVTVKGSMPARDGYEFLGWIASTGDGNNYAGSDTLAITDSDIVLYAVWDGGSVTLTYVFNNAIHNTDQYTINESQGYTYAYGRTRTIMDIEDVFPDYAGSCEFLGWSTHRDTAVEYIAGSSIYLTSDTTLYGVWKSCPPTVDDISETDYTVTGSGVPGSAILVTFPDGSTVAATVDPYGTWSVNVPVGVILHVGEIVSAIQTETGKAASNLSSTTVIGDPTIEPGIDVYVENLTTGLNYAKAGDVLLYDVIVSNNGTASSIWQSPYVTFSLDESFTLQVNSIRINNRTVTSSQYSYDSAANTLTLYLGDIVGGSDVSISFRVTVSSNISDVYIVLGAVLGSLV